MWVGGLNARMVLTDLPPLNILTVPVDSETVIATLFVWCEIAKAAA
jgi:hypothetical protein